MNQLVENFPKFSRFLSKCENMRTAALSAVSTYGEATKTAVPYVVILGCICVWICVRCFRSKRSMSVPMRSKTFREIYGGDVALKRLFEYYEAEPRPDTFHRTDSVMKDLLDDDHLDLKRLQSAVAKVEKSGTEASAVEQLKEAERAHSENPHEAYEIGMLLVELLIYEGKYKEALKHDCLKHEEISDARRPLYKAIIHIMRGNYKEAEKYWEEFNEIRELFHHKKPSSSSSSPSFGEAIDNTITDFQSFRNKVEKLKAAIHEIAANKKTRK